MRGRGITVAIYLDLLHMHLSTYGHNAYNFKSLSIQCHVLVLYYNVMPVSLHVISIASISLPVTPPA